MHIRDHTADVSRLFSLRYIFMESSQRCWYVTLVDRVDFTLLRNSHVHIGQNEFSNTWIVRETIHSTTQADNQHRGRSIQCIWYREIEDFSSSLKFLRCFGRVITKIVKDHVSRDSLDLRFGMLNKRLVADFTPFEIHSKPNEPKRSDVYRYIIKYCTENLKEIHFENITKDAIKFIKPFPKLETVKFKLCHLEGYITDQSCIEHYFPSLKKLIGTKSDLGHFVMNTIDTAIRMNTQLTELAVSCDSSGRPLQSVIEHLPSLNILGVYWESQRNPDEFKKLSAYNATHFISRTWNIWNSTSTHLVNANFQLIIMALQHWNFYQKYHYHSTGLNILNCTRIVNRVTNLSIFCIKIHQLKHLTWYGKI